jgi:hypothetical protein
MSAAIIKFKPKGSGFDPVYPTIEAHRAALAGLDQAAEISGTLTTAPPAVAPTIGTRKTKRRNRPCVSMPPRHRGPKGARSAVISWLRGSGFVTRWRVPAV